MGSATVEEYIELLNAEQHVDLQKLRDYARHGVQPEVRGEVWLYLLGVLSDDKGQEMTSVRSKYLEYDSLNKHNPVLEKRIRSECSRYYQKRLASRPAPGRTLMQSSRRIPSRPPGVLAAAPSYSRLHGDGDGSSGVIGNGAIVASLDRGPNRVNDGRIHALGGIIGDSGVSAAMDADDPEEVAAAELKRFGRSVENIICAYLNRHNSPASNPNRQDDLQRQTAHLDETPRKLPTESTLTAALERRTESSSSSSSSVVEATHDANGFDDVFGPTGSSRTHRHPSHHHGQSSSRSRSRAPSSGITLEEAVKARMPREYEWAPQLQRTTPGFDREFHPALVYLCAPFVKCVKVEAGMYFAFEKLMSMMAKYHAEHPLSLQVATFLTLFRTTLPELHSYFEEEEVDIASFATSWLQHLLANELRIEDLMRLWDTYFAVPDPLDLHLYVCIAILTNCKDSLEELDRSETKSMLYSLPPLDIDRIINEAINIRLGYQQSLREEEQ